MPSSTAAYPLSTEFPFSSTWTREKVSACRGFAHATIDLLKSSFCPFGYLGENHRTILGNCDKIIFDLHLVPALVLAVNEYVH